ncbi:alpha/beta fold hydrolase [Shinella granuli]|uniref:Alpha-beta hydrolase superfamily lysophospholipase n=1 Tax=Shinella granuli TaxID=323621 RepID=A0A4R2D328_SHIGR|nr:alpha/beta hydrolase [Shinella granuli]TCN48597.1 alpha-beta hydrolase superfamily lysophospholipase [Shinella granuli]
MFSQASTLQSPSGASLALRHEAARGVPRGILLISHGLAEHSARYAAFAARLAAEGFHVYAHDHRGHGFTSAPDAPRGQFAPKGGIARVIADMRAVRDHAAARHPGLPVVLFGHSMGGLMALAFAEAHPGDIDALAVWNSNLAPGLAGRAAQAVLAAERMLKGSDVPSDVLPRLTFGAWGRSIANRRTDFDWLSHDPAEVDAYIADPHCGFDVNVAMWIDIFAVTFANASAQGLARLPRRLPIHLVGGEEDPATDFGRAVHVLAGRLKKSRLEDVTTTVYRGMRHETLKESRPLRDPAVDAFAGWCRRVAEAWTRAPEHA